MNLNKSGFTRITGFIVMLVLLLFSITLPGAAQEEPDSTPPPRSTNRTAPEREPTILEQQATPSGVNTVILIPASADTYIASGRPNDNFGSDALFLGYNLVGDSYGAQRMLLRFDIDSAIPDGAIINSAMLRLHLTFSSPANDAPMGTVLRRLASPWNEYTVTWNTEPMWTPVDDTVFIGSALTWYEWEIRDVVANWKADVYPNDGVEIIGDEAIQQRERAFYSRETLSSFYPQLVVDYTISTDDEAPIVTVDALPQYSRRSFTVSWDGTDTGGSGIDYYDVQVRVDGGDWETWLSGVTGTEAEYSSGENGRFYEFRARGVDNVGNVEPYGAVEAETTVDSQAPTSTANPLPPITSVTSFTVSWTGNDSVSGILYYDVQYRYNNGPWAFWLTQTTATSAIFNSGGDGLYEFEVRAADNMGHVEQLSNIPETGIIVDNEAPFVEQAVWLPIIFQNSSP